MNNFISNTKWIPDLPDHRDFKYKKTNTVLPSKVDLRDKCSPVKNQGKLGSCTGNSIASMIEEEIVEKVTVSSLFIYFQERKIEGTISSDSGASIRDGIKACYKIGACNEIYYPYDIDLFKNLPSEIAYKDASLRKIKTFHRIDSLKDMLNCLASGHSVVMGFSLYESFMSDTVAKTGMMPYPKSNERLLGGHAVVAVGYDLNTKMLLVKNSWGKEWGREGYFWMPFKVVQNRYMSDDFWTIRF
jgi:C1A family cysteine protease